MRVSLDWLGDYVDLSGLSAEEIGKTFTDLGLEVEGIERQTAFQGDVVVGQVLTAVKHPNADSLRLCTVEVGEPEPLQIVCGAPNARVGIKVVVAKNGATLPGDFKIKKSKIRGEVSNGMMCSEKELQLSGQHEGIIELPESAPIGTSAAKALGLGDTILELNVTPDRSDCLGIIGLARDLGAKLGRPLQHPDLSLVRRDNGTKSAGVVHVSIADPQLCPRFVALYVAGVSVVPSPPWMQKRLTAAGMRPINLIVDATNYAMLEYSQPVHAYDARFVKGGKLEVVAGKGPAPFQTLDGQTRETAEGDILIANDGAAIGFAGIMGGKSSEVQEDTRDVIIEVAAFNPRNVRRTAKRLALKTEASHRFERGVDVDNLPNVALRVAGLLAEGAAAAGAPAPRVAGDTLDCYPADVERRVVALRLSHARSFLGLPAPLVAGDVVKTLGALEFELLDSTDDRLVFEVPYFRPDVEREVDLIEEVARLHGFDRIPYQLPVMTIRPTPEEPFIDFQEAARSVVAQAGARETATFPFVGPAEIQALGIPEDHPFYPSLSLANPINEAQGLLQVSLLPGLIRALAANRRHGERGARLFELGRGYFNVAKLTPLTTKPDFQFLAGLSRPGRHLGRRAKSDAQRPAERHWLAAVLDQPFTAKAWDTPAQEATFYHGKALLLTLVRAIGAAEPSFNKLDGAFAKAFPFLHPGAAAVVSYGNKYLGYVGELHPRAAAALDVADGGVPVVLELDLEVLFDAKGKGLKQAPEARRFPPVTRDLAFVVGHGTTHADFAGAVGKFKRKQHLTRFDLFDVYAGANLPADKKSMAYSFAFQSAERTLTDPEVEAEITALIAWLGESLQATLRG